jgi:large subunit ribosomal protein L30
MAKQLKVTLIRSTIGRPYQQEQVAAGLGLKKLNRPVVLPDTPAVRGMIRKIAHLLKVEAAQAS